MKIKKIDSKTTFIKKTIIHDIEVDGKPIKIEEYSMHDMLFDDDEYELNLDLDRDGDKFTDEEWETLENSLTEIVDIKNGEEIEVG